MKLPTALLLLAAVLPAVAQVSNDPANAALELSRRVIYFPETPSEGGSSPQLISVSNRSGSAVSITDVAVQGADATDFTISHDGCSGTLAAGAGCDIRVRFTPKAQGERSARLLLDTDSAAARDLMVLLSNREGPRSEARRRLPPVLDSLVLADASSGLTLDLSSAPTLYRDQIYTFNWTIRGYQPSQLSTIAFFRCPALNDSCARSHDVAERIAQATLAPAGQEAGDAAYRGVVDTLSHYSFTFIPGATQFAKGDRLVLRFYQKSVGDAAANRESAALLIPGNRLPAAQHYDSDGRRIVFSLQ